MNIFLRLYYSLRLHRASVMADDRLAATGARQYVVPSTNSVGALVIIDRRNFRILRRKHYIAGRATMDTVVHECFYATPRADGSSALHPDDARRRRRAYLQWVDRQRRLRRVRRNAARR